MTNKLWKHQFLGSRKYAKPSSESKCWKYYTLKYNFLYSFNFKNNYLNPIILSQLLIFKKLFFL